MALIGTCRTGRVARCGVTLALVNFRAERGSPNRQAAHDPHVGPNVVNLAFVATGKKAPVPCSLWSWRHTKRPQGENMDSAVKAQWIQALRSGEYRKGRGALHPGDDTYCVLGVLCDLFRKETDRGEWRYDGDSNLNTFVAETEDGDVDSDTALLPSPVQLWAELPSNGGIAITANRSEDPAELPYWNDDLDLPFEDLADLIERHA